MADDKDRRRISRVTGQLISMLSVCISTAVINRRDGDMLLKNWRASINNRIKESIGFACGPQQAVHISKCNNQHAFIK